MRVLVVDNCTIGKNDSFRFPVLAARLVEAKAAAPFLEAVDIGLDLIFRLSSTVTQFT